MKEKLLKDVPPGEKGKAYMAVRKTARSGQTGQKKPPHRRTPDSATRQFSAIVGVAMVGMALLWFVWLLTRQLNPGFSSLTLPIAGNLPANSVSALNDPLAAAGITLSPPAQNQHPLVSQQQAILLADQMETQAATHAGTVSALPTMVSYKSSSPTSASFQNVFAWLIHYTGVSEPPPDAADPHASSVHHDLYVFLDANNGRELLAIWL